MKILITFFCFILLLNTFADDKKKIEMTPEVADLLVKADFEKAQQMTKNEILKKELEKLSNMNNLVAESFQGEVGKNVTLPIRGREETGVLSKIKGDTLYIKIKKSKVTATWPVKVNTLPIDLRFKRAGVSDQMKNLYFGAKAFKQKNYAAAKYYLTQTGDFAKPILTAADKNSKYILSFFGACGRGELDKVKELIKKGADVNGRLIAHVKNPKTKKIEKLDSTVLIESIKNQQKEIIKYLVQNGADVNKGNAKGVTPLMFAIIYFPRDIEIVEFLLNNQADYKAYDKSGNTPLTGAVGAGREQAVRVLIKHGADVNAANKKGFTPLMLAVASDNSKMFKLLIEKGADLYKQHPQGWTVFRFNRSKMDPEIRAVLDAKAPPEKPKQNSFPVMNKGINVVPRRR